MPANVIPPESPEIKTLREKTDAHIDAYGSRMIEMSDWMYRHPESAFLEFKASQMLTEELERFGFQIERGVPGLPPDFDRLKIAGGLTPDYDGPPGLPTAFKAKYKGKTESPVFGIVVEYDALRGNPPFHGCQHNMQGPAGLGAAVALAKVLEDHDIPGSVWVIGTPAEEVSPMSKAAQAEAGYFDGVDFIVRSHGNMGNTEEMNNTERSPGGFSNRGLRQMLYTFHGKSAHAQRPWKGLSALDAVLLTFHGMEMLREHSEPQFRFHGVITNGGVAPNIVPDLAQAPIWIRHLRDETALGSVSPRKAGEMIDAKVEQLDNIARGAALATGTTLDIVYVGKGIPAISVSALNDIGFQYAVDYGGINILERALPKHYEETGAVSLRVPGTRISIAFEGIPIEPGHSQLRADQTITPEAHRSLIVIAKVMAALGLRLFMDPEQREAVRKEFTMWKEKYNE